MLMQFVPVLIKIILSINKMQLYHRIIEKHEVLNPTFCVWFLLRTLRTFKNNKTLWIFFFNQIFVSPARQIKDFSRTKNQNAQNVIHNSDKPKSYAPDYI